MTIDITFIFEDPFDIKRKKMKNVSQVRTWKKEIIKIEVTLRNFKSQMMRSR